MSRQGLLVSLACVGVLTLVLVAIWSRLSTNDAGGVWESVCVCVCVRVVFFLVPVLLVWGGAEHVQASAGWA